MMKKLTLLLCCIVAFFSCGEGTQKTYQEKVSDLENLHQELRADMGNKLRHFEKLLDEEAVEVNYAYTSIDKLAEFGSHWTLNNSLEAYMIYEDLKREDAHGYKQLASGKKLDNVFLVMCNDDYSSPQIGRSYKREAIMSDFTLMPYFADAENFASIAGKEEGDWEATLDRYRRDWTEALNYIRCKDYIALAKLRLVVIPDESSSNYVVAGLAVADVIVYDREDKSELASFTAIATNSIKTNQPSALRDLRHNLWDNVKYQIIRHLGEKVRVIED